VKGRVCVHEDGIHRQRRRGVVSPVSFHEGNGFDFGLVDEVRPAGIAAKQAGSLMRALRKKLGIDTDPKFGQVTCVWKNGKTELRRDTSFKQWLKAIERRTI
jgi:hypothetical protein